MLETFFSGIAKVQNCRSHAPLSVLRTWVPLQQRRQVLHPLGSAGLIVMFLSAEARRQLQGCITCEAG